MKLVLVDMYVGSTIINFHILTDSRDGVLCNFDARVNELYAQIHPEHPVIDLNTGMWDFVANARCLNFLFR